MTARRRMLARVSLVLALASALAVSALAEDGMCLVEGTIQWNGVPMPDGETVLCHHSGGIAVTETDGSLEVGNYRCEVADGPVTIEVRGCSFPECPVPCDGGTGAPVRCNVDHAGCANPCWTSAALALPPFWLRRRRPAVGRGKAQVQRAAPVHSLRCFGPGPEPDSLRGEGRPRCARFTSQLEDRDT